MATMASSRRSSPEEEIRQALLFTLLEKGYPRPLISVEKELKSLPHLAHLLTLPKRRLDLLVFAKAETGLLPLLLIECKAVPLTERSKRQLLGYNRYVGAPFVALANKEEVQVGVFNPEEGNFHFSKGLPAYEELLAHLTCAQAESPEGR